LPKRGKVGTGEEQKKKKLFLERESNYIKNGRKKKSDAKVCEY
jgi:hypothetical protein